MFEGFANVWTPVALSEELGKNKPLGLVVAGTPIVLFRDREGKAAALVDRCPHRGVALSLGKVKDGCIECPFHGWKLESSGQVSHVPWNPDAKLSGLKGVRVPARELAGQVWIFTALEEPAAGPEVHEVLMAPDVRVSGLAIEWKTHWTRAMENMLDSPHVPFVHRATIGRAMQRYLTPASRMEIRWEATPYGGRSSMHLDGEPDENRAWLDFYRPNVMALHIPIPGRHFHMHALCVPEERESVRLLVVGSRDFARSRLLNPFFNSANARVAAEDKAIVESSHPVEIPRPSEEVSVPSDRATLQFRRYYFEVLRGSSAAPRPRAGASDEAPPAQGPAASA